MNGAPAFSDVPKPDEALALHGWRLTYHARERMGDRGITVNQIGKLLRLPQTTAPSTQKAHCREYVGYGVTAVVDEAVREVLTVGIEGADADDWLDHRPPEDSEPLREPEDPGHTQRPRKGRKTAQRPAEPVTSTKVDPALWAACLERAGGDPRRLRVLSGGRVLILNKPNQ